MNATTFRRILFALTLALSAGFAGCEEDAADTEGNGGGGRGGEGNGDSDAGNPGLDVGVGTQDGGGGGGGGGADAGGGSDGLSCSEIIQCINDAPTEADAQACATQGSPSSQQVFNAFLQCVNTNCADASEDQFQACLQANCAAEATACQNDGGGGGGGGGAESCEDIATASEVGQECGQSSPCPEGAICIVQNSGDTTGICRQQCIPGTCEEPCGGDFCGELQNGGGACLPPPTCDDITEASEVGQACNQTSPCPTGAICIVTSAGATEGTCAQECLPGECEDFCAAGDTCEALQNGGGACFGG